MAEREELVERETMGRNVGRGRKRRSACRCGEGETFGIYYAPERGQSVGHNVDRTKKEELEDLEDIEDSKKVAEEVLIGGRSKACRPPPIQIRRRT